MSKRLLAVSVWLGVILAATLAFFSMHNSVESVSSPSQDDNEKFSEASEAMDRPDLFTEYHRGIRTREGDVGPSYPMNYQINELMKAKGVTSTQALSKAASGGAKQLSWIERGPGNVGGRTRSVIVDPADPTFNTWFVGSVNGGIWKTPDAGKTWQEMTVGLTNLATSTLAMAASNPNVIYAGTGEGFGNLDQVSGSGLWKSSDRGKTWQQLAGTVNNDFRNITRVIVDPQNENLVLVATVAGFRNEGRNGIFRSADGGQTWTLVYDAGNNGVEQILANPKNFKTQYGTVNSAAVVKSVDGGLTWRNFTNGISIAGRMELAVSPADTSRLFVSVEADTARLFLSDDGGASWALAKLNDNRDFLGGQGWYDNAIAAHPYNKDIVFAGGVSIFQFQVQSGTPTSQRALLGIDYDNTASFLSPVNFTGAVNGVRFSNLAASQQPSVEIRFGPGKSQKAHRFTVPPGSTSGVPDANYTYRDYVDVPFEVWDIDNNRQLMASFRDQLADGVFNLDTDLDRSREYIFTQAVPYAATPSPDIAKNAGHAFQQLFLVWQQLPSGAWNPGNLPVATLRVRWGNVSLRNVTRSVFQDSYRQFGGLDKLVHPDHHSILFIPIDAAQNKFKILNANDGGISYSDDGGNTFAQTGYAFYGAGSLNGYNTSQFYGLDKMNGADRYIGGTQDNGSWLSPDNPNATSLWPRALGGDGFEAVWHYRNPGKLLGSLYNNSIRRSLDGGLSWAVVSPSDNTGVTAPFLTKIAKSKQDADLVFATGASGIWRSEDFASSWTLIRMPQGFVGSSNFSQVKISLATPQVVWAGRAFSTTVPLYVSTDAGLNFTATKTYSQNLGSLTGIATHPNDEKTAYALFSIARLPKILRTTDFGQTWTDISGFGANSASSNGFPDVATFCLLVMPYDTNILWAGTEIGIFESTDGGNTWKYADNGLPPVAVWEMIIVNDEIAVATHGRGIWSVSLPQLAGYEPPAALVTPRLRSVIGGLNGIFSATIGLTSAYDSSFVLIDGAKTLRLGATSVVKDSTVQVQGQTTVAEFANVSVLSYRGGKSAKSTVKQIQLTPLQPAQVKYSNDFNDFEQDGEDFFSEGIGLANLQGFPTSAMSTSHPYEANRSLAVTLLKPIIVAPGNANLQYDDIAIVEPNLDYVVVEASADFGKTWKALEPPYDARADAKWLTAYNARQSGAPSMYKKHDLNLLQNFAAGTQIVIRFRMFSSPQITAWGWAIDNLLIQDKATSVASETPALPTAFSLAQNYPNPFNPSTTIKYAVPKPSEVQLTVFNASGQKVRTLIDHAKQSPGNYQIVWNGTNDAGQPVATGVYFYKLAAGKDYLRTMKMLFVK